MCLSHLIYTVRSWLIHTCHAMPMPCPMPCSDNAVILKATLQHGRRETACGLPSRARLLPATTRSSTKIVIVIRSIPILLTTIHTYDCKEWSSTLQKRRSVGLAVPIFPATARTFTKDTVLSEDGRGAAWHV